MYAWSCGRVNRSTLIIYVLTLISSSKYSFKPDKWFGGFSKVFSEACLVFVYWIICDVEDKFTKVCYFFHVSNIGESFVSWIISFLSTSVLCWISSRSALHRNIFIESKHGCHHQQRNVKVILSALAFGENIYVYICLCVSVCLCVRRLQARMFVCTYNGESLPLEETIFIMWTNIK